MHFGTKAEELDIPQTNKLNERMALMSERQKLPSNL
jgi:hypothetical protein